MEEKILFQITQEGKADLGMDVLVGIGEDERLKVPNACSALIEFHDRPLSEVTDAFEEKYKRLEQKIVRQLACLRDYAARETPLRFTVSGNTNRVYYLTHPDFPEFVFCLMKGKLSNSSYYKWEIGKTCELFITGIAEEYVYTSFYKSDHLGADQRASLLSDLERHIADHTRLSVTVEDVLSDRVMVRYQGLSGLVPEKHLYHYQVEQCTDSYRTLVGQQLPLYLLSTHGGHLLFSETSLYYESPQMGTCRQGETDSFMPVGLCYPYGIYAVSTHFFGHIPKDDYPDDTWPEFLQRFPLGSSLSLVLGEIADCAGNLSRKLHIPGSSGESSARAVQEQFCESKLVWLDQATDAVTLIQGENRIVVPVSQFPQWLRGKQLWHFVQHGYSCPCVCTEDTSGRPVYSIEQGYVRQVREVGSYYKRPGYKSMLVRTAGLSTERVYVCWRKFCNYIKIPLEERSVFSVFQRLIPGKRLLVYLHQLHDDGWMELEWKPQVDDWSELTVSAGDIIPVDRVEKDGDLHIARYQGKYCGYLIAKPQTNIDQIRQLLVLSVDREKNELLLSDQLSSFVYDRDLPPGEGPIELEYVSTLSTSKLLMRYKNAAGVVKYGLMDIPADSFVWISDLLPKQGELPKIFTARVASISPKQFVRFVWDFQMDGVDYRPADEQQPVTGKIVERSGNKVRVVALGMVGEMHPRQVERYVRPLQQQDSLSVVFSKRKNSRGNCQLFYFQEWNDLELKIGDCITVSRDADGHYVYSGFRVDLEFDGTDDLCLPFTNRELLSQLPACTARVTQFDLHSGAFSVSLEVPLRDR